jgi:hypothetical protein
MKPQRFRPQTLTGSQIHAGPDAQLEGAGPRRLDARRSANSGDAGMGTISDSEIQRSNSRVVDFAISVLWFLAAVPIALALSLLPLRP